MIFCGDIVIKQAITLGLQDMKNNSWLIQDALAGVSNPAFAAIYGQKEIDNCINWFKSNNVGIFSQLSNDKIELPCITIGLGSSNEMNDMATMGDRSSEVITLAPGTIGKPIPYVISPFTPTTINTQTGFVGIPTTINTIPVSVGMNLINPTNGNAYPIINIGTNGVYVAANALLGVQSQSFGIIPQYPYYKARRERGFFSESYTIGCHAVGDVSTVLWLHAITVYSILRYRESLLEANGFMQSSISSTDIVSNQNFASAVGADRAFTRTITLSGIVQNDWIKQPYRVLESVVAATSEATSFTGGVTIITNANTPADCFI